MNKDIRIMLIDAQEMVRHGLRCMIEQEKDMEVVGNYSNAEEAFPEIERLYPDIMLMDILLPGINGIEATRSMKGNGLDYDIDVIMLAGSMDSRDEALQAGATSYLLKDISQSELTQAIREAYWSKQSLEHRKGFVEEAVELAVPPPANSAHLLRFVCQLEETLHNNYSCAGIVCIVGSWDKSTVITISLGHSSLADLMDKINRMPDVEKVEEEPLARPAISSFLKRFGFSTRLGISPTKRVRVNLKETNVASQEPATVKEADIVRQELATVLN